MDFLVCICGCRTKKQLVIYLHVTLVCVDPVKQCLWSHPFYRETTLWTNTGERSNKIYIQPPNGFLHFWPKKHVCIHSLLGVSDYLWKDDM